MHFYTEKIFLYNLTLIFLIKKQNLENWKKTLDIIQYFTLNKKMIYLNYFYSWILNKLIWN